MKGVPSIAVGAGFKGLLILLVLRPFGSQAQQDSTQVPDMRCVTRTAVGSGALIAGSMLLLDQAWYSQYERTGLHSFNDGREWLQMDKAGHLFSAYFLGEMGHAAFSHCGMRPGPARWVGAGAGLLFLTTVELLDGTSAAWGFSWWDMAANAAGTGLFVGQDALWGEQRIRAKYSAHFTGYANQRPDLLGQGAAERILKDYNGQTFWLSVNPASFGGRGAVLPPWLNVAVGHGAMGMLSAEPLISAEGLPGDDRQRRWFIAPDVDLRRIRTGKAWLRTLLFVLNGIKLPAPALEWRGDGRLRAHALYF